MRRSISALMISVVLMTIVEPLAIAASLATMPACCRRNGKHHCTAVAHMHGRLPESSSPTLSNLPEQCPMRRCVRSNVSAPFTLASREIERVPAACSTAVIHDSVTFTAAGFSSHTDRGPPTL